MLSRSKSLTLTLAALAFASAACSAGAGDDATDSAASGVDTTASVRGVTVAKLGQVFGRPVDGVATETAAHALEAKVRDDARRAASELCASTLGLPVGAVSTKLVGVRSSVSRDASDGRFVVAASAQQAYCASASLDDAVLVTWDGQLHADATLRAGAPILLDPGLDRVAADVAVEVRPSVRMTATTPHLLVRFDGGAFGEMAGLPRVDAKAGGSVDVERPFDDAAVLFEAPRTADRFEMFFRVDRWTVTGFFEDGNFTGTFVAPASAAFVSNFGANYRLAIGE